MKPKVLILFLAVLYVGLPYSQTYNDTLFFKSGMERPADIVERENKTLKYYYLNSKEERKYATVQIGKLKYYVVYDSLNNKEFDGRSEGDRIKLKPRTDSISMSRHLLSINPFAIPLLGINVMYTKRLGPNMKWGVHIPVRLVGLLLTQFEPYGYFGVGATYFLTTNEKTSFTAGITAGLHLVSGNAALSIPVNLGFVSYLNDFWAITGQAGIGPGFDLNGNGLYSVPLPTAHLAVTLQLGRKEIIQGY